MECPLQKYISKTGSGYSSIHSRLNYKMDNAAIQSFVKECVQLCWLMSVQDPPVVIGSYPKHGDVFDLNKYKAYTKSGSLLEYMVWPPLYLHHGGPLLEKGVAQAYGEQAVSGKTRRSKQSTSTSSPGDVDTGYAHTKQDSKGESDYDNNVNLDRSSHPEQVQPQDDTFVNKGNTASVGHPKYTQSEPQHQQKPVVSGHQHQRRSFEGELNEAISTTYQGKQINQTVQQQNVPVDQRSSSVYPAQPTQVEQNISTPNYYGHHAKQQQYDNNARWLSSVYTDQSSQAQPQQNMAQSYAGVTQTNAVIPANNFGQNISGRVTPSTHELSRFSYLVLNYGCEYAKKAMGVPLYDACYDIVYKRPYTA